MWEEWNYFSKPRLKEKKKIENQLKNQEIKEKLGFSK